MRSPAALCPLRQRQGCSPSRRRGRSTVRETHVSARKKNLTRNDSQKGFR